jgi:hypothetical protein
MNVSHWTTRDLGGKVLRDYQNTGRWTLFTDYVYRDGLHLAAETQTGQRHFHLNYLRTPCPITRASGRDDRCDCVRYLQICEVNWMSNYDPSARDELIKALCLRLGEDIGYDDFRMLVEDIYNFRLDHSLIPKHELEIFEQLFDAVARYSPFIHDREAYPTMYKDEGQIDEVVGQVRRALGLAVER